MNSPVISLRDIAVERGGRTILEIESLDVDAGEVLTVIGPNGAGKSTMLQVMALLDRSTRGQVLFSGEAVSGARLRYRRRMALVFQEPLLLDTSVESNVRAGLALRGVAPAEQRQRVDRWLENFGIAALAPRSARTLSGGEAQRTSLARAMVLEPDLLLLDEPFAALDTPTREALMNDLDDILTRANTATVFVTHDRAEALRLGNRLAVLMGGRMRQEGTPAEIFAAPVDEEVAAFVGLETIARGRIRSAENGIAIVDVGDRSVEAAAEGTPGAEVLVCLRPENVVLAAPADAERTTSARNHLTAVVQRVIPVGPYLRVELDAGFVMAALITRQSLEDLEIAPGGTVVASFKATAVHLIERSKRHET